MIRKTIGGTQSELCSKCNQPVFFVQRYMGKWMALDTELVDKGPRYSMHTEPSGIAYAVRESHVKGYKNHHCPKDMKPPIGGHTPQLF